jgi:4-diphosphocytidyl-2-C-methyl-D-erythritol kinase
MSRRPSVRRPAATKGRDARRRRTNRPVKRIQARALAKVNLDLRVLGTRPDGYHELRTVFQTIDLCDVIVAQEKPGPFTLKCRAAGVPLDDTNLVWRSGARLWTALGRAGEPRDTLVTIDKQIPMQAGLGGGSADAAAALLVLARLWGGAPISLLREVAAGIGSDVPFFLSGGTALGLGRGEEIYPLVDLPRHWIVIVRPPFGVSTVEAYSWYDEDRAAGVREPRSELQILPVPWPTRAAQMVNDLEPPVVRRHPEIGTIKAWLKEAGALAAAMSGSGSAVFGLFRTHQAAVRAMRSLARTGASCVLSRTLTRGEHETRARPILKRV